MISQVQDKACLVREKQGNANIKSPMGNLGRFAGSFNFDLAVLEGLKERFLSVHASFLSSHDPCQYNPTRFIIRLL